MPSESAKNLNNFKAIITTLKLPNLSNIPIYLKHTLKQCFLHEAESRPKASTLPNIFKGIFLKNYCI